MPASAPPLTHHHCAIRNTRNDTDGIYNGLTTAAKSALTLATMASHGEPWRAMASSGGYTGIINLVVQVG